MTFQERRKGDICTCGHHLDDHPDWNGERCESCDCDEYAGTVTRWDTTIDGPHPLLALIKKDTSFEAPR